MLTDVDIKRYLGKHIVIEPFESDSLSPIGYDFRVGEFLFSLEHGLLILEDGIYNLPAQSTIQILTKESLWVSSRIAGTFHSRVSLVSIGLSHISTTLDPGWYGPLLITMRNNTTHTIPLKENMPFVTLIFYRVSTPTKFIQRKFSFVADILLGQIENQTANYIKRVRSILGDSIVKDEFERKVKKANALMPQKVSLSLKRLKITSILLFCFYLVIVLLIIALLTLNFYWNKINTSFFNIKYDSTIFGMQYPTAIALIALLISLRKKIISDRKLFWKPVYFRTNLD